MVSFIVNLTQPRVTWEEGVSTEGPCLWGNCLDSDQHWRAQLTGSIRTGGAQVCGITKLAEPGVRLPPWPLLQLLSLLPS